MLIVPGSGAVCPGDRRVFYFSRRPGSFFLIKIYRYLIGDQKEQMRGSCEFSRWSEVFFFFPSATLIGQQQLLYTYTYYLQQAL